MAISAAAEPVRSSDEAAAKHGERRALGVACGAHMLHDGYTDLVWVALPIWQAEFGLNYAVVGLLRTVYSGTLATLQIPAAAVAARIGAGAVLATEPPSKVGRRVRHTASIRCEAKWTYRDGQ